MRLSNVLSLSSGKSIKIRELNDSDDYPVYGGNGINGTYNDYNVETDTIVIGRVGFYCGSVYKTNSRAWVTDNALIATLKVSNLFNADFLTYMLQYMKLGSTAVSSAQPVVSGRGILPLIIPVPPLIEQRRIVCSYVNILPYIENIENAKRDTKELTSSIKSKILDLAIRGKLVPQDPNDEPASVLLERIKAEKEELIKQGKIKRDKKESVIFKGEDNSYYHLTSDNKSYIEYFPFELPNGWEWCNLSMISQIITKGTTPRGGNVAYVDKGIGFLRAENVSGFGKLDTTDLKYVTDDAHNNFLKRSILCANDILITIAGTLGRTAIVQESELPLNTNQAVSIVRPINYKLLNLMYVIYAVNAPEMGVLRKPCK